MEEAEIKLESSTDTAPSVKSTILEDDEPKWKKDLSPVSNGIEEARMAFVTKMVGTFATVNGDSEEHFNGTCDDHPLENGVTEEPSSAHTETKDEQRSLQEIEMERRRIIDNQVVRRKKIDHWAFSEQSEKKDEEETYGGSRFERLRQMAPPKAPPPPPPAMHESMRKYEERKQERIKCSNSINQKKDSEEDSESDLVDCASILEQKEQLKSFWERKMMGDQPSPVNNGVVEVDASRKPEEKEHPQCNGVAEDGSSEPSTPTPAAESTPVKDLPTDSTTTDSKPGDTESPKVNGVVDHPEESTVNGDLDGNAPSELHASVAEVEVHVDTVEPQNGSEQEQPSVDEQEVTEPSKEEKEEEPQVKSVESSNGPEMTEESVSNDATELAASGEADFEKVVTAASEDEIANNGPTLPEEEVEEDVFVDVNPSPATEAKSPSPPPFRVPTAPKHVTTVPTTEVPYSNFTTETKIAMEIREMREREEELIQMRERLSKLQLPIHREETKSLSPPHSLQCNGHAPSKEQNSMTRTVSLDSLHPVQQLTAPLFHHARRKDVTVRPLADDETDDTSPTYKVLNESPVEREIKRAAEREEALRKEKGIFPRTGSGSSVSKSPTDKVAKAKPPSTACYSGNTQRLLATSRIQQEIQEQTLREVALRETGQIQTISEERTDARVARLGEMSSEVQPKKATSPTPATPSPTPEPETESARTVVVNGEGTAKLSSPTSSTSSSTSAMPPSRRLYGPSSIGGRGISMQRFIATRGKEVAFVSLSPKNTTPPSPDKTPSPVTEVPDVKKQPSPVRFGNGAVKPLVTSKRALTAESRIQQELMEMKAREEELRQQRVRLFGRSQPDLTIITNGDKITNGLDSSETDSVPSISNKKKTEKDTMLKGPRRRHTMIAEWEKIIQSAEGK